MKEIDKKEAIARCSSLIRDCKMALDGSWDVSSIEAGEGFNIMIEYIESIKDYIKNN